MRIRGPAAVTEDDVVLDAKRRHEETVNDILRRHHQPDLFVDRNMQRIDLALTARVLDLPHPLLPDDVDLLARWPVRSMSAMSPRAILNTKLGTVAQHGRRIALARA